MKFKIIQKLFLLILIPIITLSFFSLNSINYKYAKVEHYQLDLRNLELLKNLQTLIYSIQYERLASLDFLNSKKNIKEKKLLNQMRLTTDTALQALQYNLYTSNNDVHTQIVKSSLDSLSLEFTYLHTMRTSINDLKMETYIIYDYYSNINRTLLLILNNFQFQHLSIEANIDLAAFKEISQLQEFAAQERGVISKIFLSSVVDPYDFELFNSLIVFQNNSIRNIEFLLKNHPIKNDFTAINTLYSSNNFIDFRDNISDFNFDNNSNNTLNKKELNQWTLTSHARSNDFNLIKTTFIERIESTIVDSLSQTQRDFIFLIFITVMTLFLLLVGAFYISHSIKSSIKELEKGIKNFFKYLNFESTKPDNIHITTNDEIADISHRINEEILLTEKIFEEDEDFIAEITGVLSLMRDGDFNERIYFEPKNPRLKELKLVFDELIDLISKKIKDQTDSLESLNASLEERVHFQTLKLEKQIQEITIAMEKAVAAEISKDEFLANMSHEIRTPLNAILGFVTILKKTIKDEKPLNYLNIIDTSGKSLLTIINDILDFSKIKSGKFTIAPHHVSIINIMSDSTLLFASKAYEKYLQLAVYIDPNMPRVINIDSVRVIQVFSNILSNAIKFTQEDGSIEVNVTCDNAILKVSIKDSGIGISPKNIDKVFSAFEQADGSTTRKYGGTGLGLSISYNLAKLMDGDITVKSQEGVGSTFTLTLPIDIIDNNTEVFTHQEKLKDCTIAILDNNQKQNKRGLIKRYLEDLGVTKILQISKFQEDGYDLLFFTPDDEYNEDIVYSEIPAIALLRNSSIKLAKLDHINPLSLPYTPKGIIQAIQASNILTKNKKQEAVPQVEEDTQVEFIGSILVAEDNKTNQMLISLLLEDYGLDFTLTNNGLEVVEQFKKEKYDLVLMDENMPELNGIGAMQQIRAYEEDNNLSLTPIIALTASVLQSDKEKFLNAGMDGFVGKPIDNDELDSELGRFLKQRN